MEVCFDDIVEQRRERIPDWTLAIVCMIGQYDMRRRIEKTYHDQKAIMNPNHEKKKTRPWILITLNRGTERALWLMGLSSGALQSKAGLKPTILIG